MMIWCVQVTVGLVYIIVLIDLLFFVIANSCFCLSSIRFFPEYDMNHPENAEGEFVAELISFYYILCAQM